jgi:eukaryotic-like serine/threonine-protein kinase
MATRSGRGMSWWRWLLACIGGLAVAFAIGYLIAVFVIFPPTRVARGGLPVPKLTGLDLAAAQQELRTVGLTLGDTMALPNTVEPVGAIVAQSPLPGQQLQTGGRVRVAVSSGPPRAILPDVKSFEVTKAATLLASLGFQVTQQTEQTLGEAGRVLRMEPKPGVEYSLPARVTIVVSIAPLPAVPDSLHPASQDTSTQKKTP